MAISGWPGYVASRVGGLGWLAPPKVGQELIVSWIFIVHHPPCRERPSWSSPPHKAQSRAREEGGRGEGGRLEGEPLFTNPQRRSPTIRREKARRHQRKTATSQAKPNHGNFVRRGSGVPPPRRPRELVARGRGRRRRRANRGDRQQPTTNGRNLRGSAPGRAGRPRGRTAAGRPPSAGYRNFHDESQSPGATVQQPPTGRLDGRSTISRPRA